LLLQVLILTLVKRPTNRLEWPIFINTAEMTKPHVCHYQNPR
jgi:hypothetical protein